MQGMSGMHMRDISTPGPIIRELGRGEEHSVGGSFLKKLVAGPPPASQAKSSGPMLSIEDGAAVGKDNASAPPDTSSAVPNSDPSTAMDIMKRIALARDAQMDERKARVLHCTLAHVVMIGCGDDRFWVACRLAITVRMFDGMLHEARDKLVKESKQKTKTAGQAMPAKGSAIKAMKAKKPMKAMKAKKPMMAMKARKLCRPCALMACMQR